MAAKYILASLALVFLCAGGLGITRARHAGQARAWLLIGAIFGTVSAWLFVRSR